MIALGLSLVLGVALAVALNGSEALNFAWNSEVGVESVAVDTAELQRETVGRPPSPASAGPTVSSADTATPTLAPLRLGGVRGEDLDDVLLLYESTSESSFDINFRMVAEYYGLRCAILDLESMDLTDESLRDARGEYFKLVGISGDILLGRSPLLTESEIGMIREAIERGGVDLLVWGMRAGHDATHMAQLTDGGVVGATEVPNSCSDWVVSSEAPEVTRELTGQVVASWAAQKDTAFILSGQEGLTVLVETRDDAGMSYPIFVRQQLGQGMVFATGGQEGKSLRETLLVDMYYDKDSFSQVLPVLLTLRYSLGNEAWHNDHNYANLTIDDPALTEPFRNLSFVELLREMNSHDFHTTVAFIPKNWGESEPRVVRLFLARPDRYSLEQHGNNHDGYEFYKYSVSEDDDYHGRKLPARPLADQEADIVQGLLRMEQHRRSTGIPHERVMIFPWGISPEPTLVVLKRHNFLATVNAQEVPLDASRSADWDYGMYQANMDYGNFPTVFRRSPGTYPPFQPRLLPFILDLLIDKPALFYAYTGLFESGMDTFNAVADQMNQLPGGVEWRSLGYVIKHLYLEKKNDDGSVDVKMYANHLIVTNASSDEITYHVAKKETSNVPISLLTVNGHEFSYRVDGGMLSLDVLVPPDTSVDVLIHYGK